MQETTPEQLVSLAKRLPDAGYLCIARYSGLGGFSDMIFKKTHYEGVLFAEQRRLPLGLSVVKGYSLKGLSCKPIFHVNKEDNKFSVEDDRSLNRYVGSDIMVDGILVQSLFNQMSFETMSGSPFAKKASIALARNIMRLQIEDLLDGSRPCDAIGVYSSDFILYSNTSSYARLSGIDDVTAEPDFRQSSHWDMLFDELKSLR